MKQSGNCVYVCARQFLRTPIIRTLATFLPRFYYRSIKFPSAVSTKHTAEQFLSSSVLCETVSVLMCANVYIALHYNEQPKRARLEYLVSKNSISII